MSIGSDALAAVIATFPEGVVSLRYAGSNKDLTGTVASAFQSGMERIRQITEEGNVDGADGNIRYLTSAEPSAWAAETNGAPAIDGQIVEIKFYGESEWVRFKVASRLPIQGAVRMNLLAEFEEVA